mgnify:CR=1 FL=1
MAEHSFDSPDRDIAAEIELLRSANTLPALSNRLRARVLNAATSAYRQARRWAQARQAASFLSVCLLTSFVLSPVANFSLPSFASPVGLASLESFSSPQQLNSAWTLRHDREFLGLPPESKIKNQRSKTENLTSHLVAHVEPSRPRDKLLSTLHSSDGWATVQAFQAVRARSHSTLQRAFAAN